MAIPTPASTTTASATIPDSGTARSLWYYYWSPGRLNCSCIQILPSTTIFQCIEKMLQQSASATPPFMTRLYKVPEGRPILLHDYALALGQLSISDLEGPLPVHSLLSEVLISLYLEDRIQVVFVNSINIQFRLDNGGPTENLCLKVLGSQVMFEVLGDLVEKSILTTRMDLNATYGVSFLTIHDFNTMQDFAADHQVQLETEVHQAFKDQAFSNFLGIVVKLRPRVSKDPLSWSPAERVAKRPKLHDHAPSSMRPSVYRNLQQQPDERILDYRCLISDDEDSFSDKYLPPIEALFSGFGRFLECWRGQYKPGFTIPVLTEDLKEDVDAFADSMARIYANASERQEFGLQGLNKFFKDNMVVGRKIESSTIVATTGGVIKSNGHYRFGPRRIPCIITEFKNEGAETNAIPEVELANHYSRMVNDVGDSNVRERSRFPTLGITVIGATVTMSALAFVGPIVSVPLTPRLWCLRNDRSLLYAAFAAASYLLNSITCHAETLTVEDCRNLPPVIASPFLPDINKLPRIDGCGSEITFKITEILDKNQKSHSRHLYRAATLDNPPIQLVIKLTYSYSAQLHLFCAKHDFAPHLFAVDRLPGGIFAVAMEYLDGNDLQSLSYLDRQFHYDSWPTKVRDVVKKFHKEGYVHGDLRAPNIICYGHKIALVDFDWGGEHGKVSYPTRQLNEQLTKGRNMASLKITFDDDLRVLQETISHYL